MAGVVDSSRCVLDYQGLDASRVLAFFNDEAQSLDEATLISWMRDHPFDDLVVLDITASQSWQTATLISPASVFMWLALINWLGRRQAMTTAKSATLLRKPAVTGCITLLLARVCR